MKDDNFKAIKSFYVINEDFYGRKMGKYDVIPYLVNTYKSCKRNKPTNIEELKKFIVAESRYQFWSRCEYEIILSSWPPKEGSEEKWDVFDQIMMNIDLITLIVANQIRFPRKKTTSKNKKENSVVNDKVS